jgi:hypothetical protein
MTDAIDALPSLDGGVTLLTGADRTALAALVLAELDRRDGPARWVDARNHASTYALTDAARSHRVLDEVQVARAFTAHQHHALVRQLVADAGRPTSLVVAPLVDDLYADDDLLDCEAERLREATLSTLDALAAACDVPVLVTASDPERVREHADAELEVEPTKFGPRFARAEPRSANCSSGRSPREADESASETTAYWTRGGWQTTIPYWVDLFGAVEEPAVPEPALPEVVA